MIAQLTLGLLLCSPLALASPPGESTGAFVDLGFDEARALAQKENKLLLVDFFTTWCGPCKKLDAVTWPDAGVQRWLLENVVAIKIDAEKDLRAQTMYEVNVYPSLIFMTPDGAELKRLAGFLPPEQFLGSARMVVAAMQDGEDLARRVAGPEQHVPKTRHAYASYLAGMRKTREAAKHYLWCYDEGVQHDASYAQVRRKELLADMVSLSRTWIRGKRELRSRREACAERLLSESGTLEDALDLAALDTALQRRADTLTTYVTLIEREDEASHRRAAGLLDSILDHLVGPKRYKEITACQPDFDQHLDVLLASYETLCTRFQKLERARPMLESERSAIITRGTLYFEVLLATGSEQEAHALAERLIGLDKTARTFLALGRRAKRMGDRKEALAWASRGLLEVPENQRASLQVMKKSLEREIESAGH